MTSTLTPAQAIAQRAAEYAWACGTSEDSAVASSASAVYRAADHAFATAVITAYGLTAEEAEEARELLAEYGPDDALRGTTGRGVFSYVQAARDKAAERHAWNALSAVEANYPDAAGEVAGWTVHRDGLAGTVVTLDLADGQVAPLLRQLGPGWQLRPEAGELDAWDESPVITFASNPSPSYLASLAAERAGCQCYPPCQPGRLSNAERTITLTPLAADKLADALYIRLGGYANGPLFVQANDDRSVTITLAG